MQEEQVQQVHDALNSAIIALTILFPVLMLVMFVFMIGFSLSRWINGAHFSYVIASTSGIFSGFLYAEAGAGSFLRIFSAFVLLVLSFAISLGGTSRDTILSFRRRPDIFLVSVLCFLLSAAYFEIQFPVR